MNGPATRLAGVRWRGHAPLLAIVLSLVLAWTNFLTTARWADQPGSLHGFREPWYALVLVIASLFTLARRHDIGRAVSVGGLASGTLLITGALVLLSSLFSRLPLSTWSQIPFKDDWTPLYQQAVNGAALLRRGVVSGWSWHFLGGYPTSTDIAQNFSALAFLPMQVFGPRVGYHVLHAVLFVAVPIFVWIDLRREKRELRMVATGLACFFASGYFGAIGSSGDTNSLVGVFCAGVALVGGHLSREGSRWGGALLMLGLTLALYTHTAFFVYAAVYLALEAAWARDPSAAVRLVAAAALALVAALPVHWESLRHPEFVSFNNTVYDPDAPTDWSLFFRTVYYNVEILALPQRWFNDYRSLANVWLPALLVAAFSVGQSRAGFYALAAIVTQFLLRFNTPEAGAGFDRIQHMLPLLTAPALAGFVLRFGGARMVAVPLLALIALYVQTSLAPVRHVPDLRAFDPPLMDRIAASDGVVLVEISPHRDMDRDPSRRSPTTPFDVHFEGLLPELANQRFYSQSVDGWVWNSFRGQVVGAGTFRGQPIAETPIDQFVAEMKKWGVRNLFVWTDLTRRYLASSDGRFEERWRSGLWSHYVLRAADVRSVVTTTGSGDLRNLDFLGADVQLAGVAAGDPVIVRSNYYPAWRAFSGDQPVPLYAEHGQLAFRAPRDGTQSVRLEYPRYRGLSVVALTALLLGVWMLTAGPLHQQKLSRWIPGAT